MTFFVNAQLLNNSGILQVKNNPLRLNINAESTGKQKNIITELLKATTHVNLSSENKELYMSLVSRLKTSEAKVNSSSKVFLDSIVTKTTSGTYTKKDVIYYDKNGNDTTILRYDWDIANSEWLLSLREKSVKDNNGLLLSYETYLWIGGFYFMGSIKYENTYNSNNDVLTKTEYTWDVLTRTWKYSSKSENLYDANNYLIRTTVSSRDNVLNVWNQQTKSVFNYDLNNKLISETDFNWDNTALNWVNNIKDDHFYDTQGNDTLKLEYKWDTGASVWNINNKIRFIYDSNTLSTRIENWDWNNAWTETGKLEYTYNSNKQITIYAIYSLDSKTSIWKGILKTESIYDGNNYKTIENKFDWDTPTSAWFKIEISTYYYSSNTTGTPSLTGTNPVIYPNPVSNELQISGLNSNADISILDVTGKTIFTQKNSEKTIDVTALNEGIYFLQITNKTGSVNYKFIKIHSR